MRVAVFLNVVSIYGMMRPIVMSYNLGHVIELISYFTDKPKNQWEDLKMKYKNENRC